VCYALVGRNKILEEDEEAQFGPVEECMVRFVRLPKTSRVIGGKWIFKWTDIIIVEFEEVEMRLMKLPKNLSVFRCMNLPKVRGMNTIEIVDLNKPTYKFPIKSLR